MAPLSGMPDLTQGNPQNAKSTHGPFCAYLDRTPTRPWPSTPKPSPTPTSSSRPTPSSRSCALPTQYQPTSSAASPTIRYRTTCDQTQPCTPWLRCCATTTTPPSASPLRRMPAGISPSHVPAEVICHGDVAPYNCVFRDGRPVAFIDFDTAHPGVRIWDLAYAAYRFRAPDRSRQRRLHPARRGTGPPTPTPRRRLPT